MRRFLAVVAVGLAGSLLALSPASGTVAHASRPGDPVVSRPGDPVVTISANCSGSEFCFTPSTLTVADGDAVTWSNHSGTEHIVSRCDPADCNGMGAGTGTDRGFTTGDVPSAGTFSHTFHGPGTYPYFCSIHGFAVMHGVIVVTAATPTSTATTPAQSAVTTAAAATAPTPAAPELAHTGSPTGSALAIGIGTLAVGLAATASKRRRARPQA